MAAPTRAQITGSSGHIKPLYKVDWLDGTTWRTLQDEHIVSVNGAIQSTGNIDNGLAFGSQTNPSASITCTRETDTAFGGDPIGHDDMLLQKMRIRFAWDTSDYLVVFKGVVNNIEYQNDIVTFNLVGLLEYARTTKLYTPVYYAKPIATATTLTSIENPATGGYNAGLMNRILWEAGGRPYEQEGVTYTEGVAGCKFFYSLQQSTATPDWSWVGGEDLIDELYALARAGGGQLYQDTSGVIRFANQLSFGDATGYSVHFVYNDSMYASYSATRNSVEYVQKVTATYTERQLDATQEIFSDTSPKILMPSQTKEFIFEPQLPIYEYIDVAVDTFASNLKATYITGNAQVNLTINSVTTSATRITASITNSAAIPVLIHSVKINGRPLGAVEDKTISVGSGTPERILESNTYVQSEPHAKMLCQMIYDFYIGANPIVTLQDALYDPDRYVGELVQIHSTWNQIWNGSAYIDNNNLHRIIGIAHDNTGQKMTLTLVDVTGVPNFSDMFIIGTVYAGADVNSLGY